MAGKVFSERAKANAAQIQAATDYLTAQLQAKASYQAAQTKIHGDLQQSLFDVHEQRATERAQAADQAASDGSQAPEPYPITPLPSANQPSQSLQGATVGFYPSQVSGGGGIQAAAAAQGQQQQQPGVQYGGMVPPTITTQSTESGTRPVPIGESGFAGGVMQAPYAQTTTRTIPNVLTAYQAGQLAQGQGMVEARRAEVAAKVADLQGKGTDRWFKAVSEVRDTERPNLAAAIYALRSRQISQSDFNGTVKATQMALDEVGDPRPVSALLQEAAAGGAKLVTDEAFKNVRSQPEIYKDMMNASHMKVGSPNFNETMDRIHALGYTPDSTIGKRWAIEYDSKFLNDAKGAQIADDLYKFAADPANAGFFGSAGRLTRAGTTLIGGAKSLVGLVGGEEGLKVAGEYASQKLSAAIADPNTDEKTRTVLQGMVTKLNQPEKLGQFQYLVSTLGILMSSQSLDRNTVMGIKTFTDNVIRAYDEGDAKTAQTQLKLIADAFRDKYNNDLLLYDRYGQTPPQHRFTSVLPPALGSGSGQVNGPEQLPAWNLDDLRPFVPTQQR